MHCGGSRLGGLGELGSSSSGVLGEAPAKNDFVHVVPEKLPSVNSILLNVTKCSVIGLL